MTSPSPQPRHFSISRQIVMIMLLIVVFVTAGLSIVIGLASFNNLATITLDELDRMSKIFVRHVSEMQHNAAKSIAGIENNQMLLERLEQLTNLGPYYVSDPSLHGRAIEEADRIYSLQAQLEIIQALQPLKNLHQLSSISLYQLSPFNQVPDAEPILSLRLDDWGIWVAQFNTKGSVADRSYHFAAWKDYRPPSPDYFDVSSVYQMAVDDFYRGAGIQLTSARSFEEFFGGPLKPDQPESSSIEVADGVPVIHTWARLQIPVSNPVTWEAERVPAMLVVLEQKITSETLQTLRTQLGIEVALAENDRILVSSLPGDTRNATLEADRTLESAGQSFYFAAQPLRLDASSGSLQAIVLSPISVLAQLTRTLFEQMSLFAVLATVLASFALIWTIRGLINRPLNQLMEGVGKIAEGNLEHKVQMDSQNEFGQLASAFNIMSSELNKKSAELRNKIEALKELDQLKDAFLANTSHELRTPLNGIIGIAESMIDGATGALSERQKANLAMVVASGKRLSSLVNDILDFSKMRHHDLQLQRSAVDIGSLTEVVLTLSRPLVKQRSLELINELPRDLPAVNADENRLQQILHNLIGNAIKFTAAGQVRVSARILGDDMEISVCDTGIGIAPEKLETIFESFKQAEESTSRQYGGTGLGLAVTKQLVELHGGHIGVESRPGQGSRFFFSLPLAGRAADVSTLEKSLRGVNDEPLHTHVDFVELRSIAQPVRPVELTGNGEVEPQDEAGPATEEYTVLAVDDEPVNLQVINNQLSLHRYRVIEAINGMEALALIEQGLRPDLILLDVMMPRMSGFEVCRKLRERFSARELPVMLLTAKNQATDLIEGFSSGANDYLTKPFSKHELLARIRLHIRLSQASLELIEKEALVREYASNLESSNQQLKQYQSTLEERVEQRTSELKLAHQQLMETEKMASLGGLVAGVAHEINTPVGIGVTAASFLLDEINQIHNTYALGNITREDFDQFLQRALQTADMILSNLRRAAELIKSFKQVAVDQSVEDARQFNLHSYLEDVLTTLHPRLRRTRHEITIDVDPSLVVENYPGTFSQILTNLLMNSLTHAFGNQESGEIHIAMQRQDDQLQMIYTDNGQGIESTHLSRIFDPFFTTRRGQGGTGLGLHIVYNLVTQKLKGRIQCESEPGQGVRFTLTLPCVFITVPALSSNQNPV